MRWVTSSLNPTSRSSLVVATTVPLRARLEKAAQAASKRYDISECMRLMQQIYDDVLREKKAR